MEDVGKEITLKSAYESAGEAWEGEKSRMFGYQKIVGQLGKFLHEIIKGTQCGCVRQGEIVIGMMVRFLAEHCEEEIKREGCWKIK